MTSDTHNSPRQGGQSLAGQAKQSDPKGQSLRELAFRGGGYLALREGVGMVIRLGGVVAVTRLIGPHDYGIYVAAAAFVTLVATVCQLGAEVFLIRQSEDPTLEQYQQVFSALVVVSAAVSLVALALSWPAELVVGNQRDLDAFRLLLVSVPLNILWAPAQAKLERSFRYRRMAWVELSGDLALYLTAVPLAFEGAGVYAPVAGWIASQAVLLVASWLAGGLRPRWRWSTPVFRQLVGHGISYSASTWIDKVNALANPVIVGALVGATGVGLVGLALRLVDTAGFALRATWRLALAAISRMVDEPERLRQAMEEGMLAQALVLGAPLAGLAVLSPWLIPAVFGRSWAPAATVFGLLALKRLVSSPVMPQMALLFARARNSVVARAAALNAVVGVICALVLVPLLGINGFAAAGLISSLSWLYLDVKVRPEVGFRYGQIGVATVALGVPMLAPLVPWPWGLALALPALLLVASSGTRSALLQLWRLSTAGLRAARPVEPETLP